VLFTSGYSYSFLEETGLGLEGSHLLRKPYGAVRLLRTVREILDRKAAPL
jgi:hypothetical protein